DEAKEAARAADAPALHEWKATAPSVESPGRDAYALRLVASHTLYDEGRIVRETPVLSKVRRARLLRVNPADLGRLGVESGGSVKVTSARGSQTLTALADENVPPGAAHVAFSADGEGVATLIDASAPVTDLRVESVR
ncbi:MAG TPA: molybdopterin dinucleotide binding domain-containing protein, partial [Acidimicrobiia bacterium]|nr:molybdopterin dinucleotide binding domain-containing protein [Acidimicrobiia bacterium]